MKDEILEALMVREDESTLTCMKKLDAKAHKILFVVDAGQRLVGSLTDGDIRRWILAGSDLQDPIRAVCNHDPITLPEEHTLDEVRELMLGNKIECIPIVDTTGSIAGVVFWTDLFQEEPEPPPLAQLDVPVVVMAGGVGQRLRPFTTILPKPLIPIGEKTITEHIIDRFVRAGVRTFYMTLNHKSGIIRAYFDEVEKDYELQYVVEAKPLGTAGSLKLLADRLPEAFILTNCDTIIRADYADILEFHRSNDFEITVVSSMMHYQVPYGVCEIDVGGALVKIKEKPELSFLISTGMYILNRRVLDHVQADTSYHVTHLIEDVKKGGGAIGVYPISENSWDDTGEWEEYQKAIRKLTHDLQ
jgi:dTDP-glucose pyrophosphorylase